MSSYTQARDEIVSLIEAAVSSQQPGLQLFYENTLELDLDSVSDPFVRIEIDFDDAEQLTVNDAPWHRVYGSIVISVFTKEGAGTRRTLELLDFFSEVVRFHIGTKFVSTVPRPGRRQSGGGWVSRALDAEFYFDVTD